MRGVGGSQGRRCELGGLCISGVLLVGLASSAVAQSADKAETNNTDSTDSETWTSESHNDPEHRRNQMLRNLAILNSASGVVRLASGEAPYPPVEVFFCEQPVGSTDKRGRFRVTAPAGPRGRCFLTIQHPGMKPLSLTLRRSTQGSGRVFRLGVLVLEPLPGFEGRVTSATTREAPKAALRAYQKGMREQAKPEPDLEKAAARFEEAVALFPRFAEALNALGRARLGLGDIEGSILALETSIAADGDFPLPYRMLLGIRMQRHELRPAAVIAAALLRLTPGDGQARYYHALATFGLQRYDEAAASAQALIDKGSGERFPQAFQILGEIHADRGEIEEAARNFLAYLDLAPDSPSAPQIRERLRDWENAEAILSDGKGAAGP